MRGQGGGAGEQHGYSKVFLVLLGLAVLAAIAGLGWSYHLSGRLTHAETQLLQAQQQNEKLASALNETNSRLKTNETLGHSLGARQKQVRQRARDLLKRQEASARRLQTEQQSSEQQDNSVANGTGAMGNTQGAAPLQSTNGDLGIPSGPVATNQQELESLEKKGERRYYPFTLEKGKKQAVSTVSLQLKKADVKHNRYALIVYTNNVKIEKKDRGLNEPVQFYVGKENLLYELVVNSIEKNVVKGYLATPLNAPVPGSTSGS